MKVVYFQGEIGGRGPSRFLGSLGTMYLFFTVGILVVLQIYPYLGELRDLSSALHAVHGSYGSGGWKMDELLPSDERYGGDSRMG
jgi:hypothetical protein